MFHCVMVIAKHEGFGGFFKGALPSVLKAAPNSALHFAVYNAMVECLKEKQQPENYL